jgi:hypothetical protein
MRSMLQADASRWRQLPTVWAEVSSRAADLTRDQGLGTPTGTDEFRGARRSDTGRRAHDDPPSARSDHGQDHTPLMAPGATITYDVHGDLGDGIPLLLIASPMDAVGFTTLASHVTGRPVVTYDPRAPAAAGAATATASSPRTSTPRTCTGSLTRWAPVRSTSSPAGGVRGAAARGAGRLSGRRRGSLPLDRRRGPLRPTSRCSAAR